jgi:type IV fimbrial biogenesis protein FimT
MSSQEGFTLLEVTLVIFILGISAALATPSVLESMARYRLSGAARQVMGDLMWVKMRAVSEKNKFRVFVLNDHEYRILDDDDNNGKIDAGEWSRVRDIRDQYPDVTIHFTADLIFFPRGTAQPGTITLTNNSGSKKLKIHITGRVKIS